MSIEERSASRRKRIKSYRAKDFADAERWDLLFWQELSPEERLSAFVALRKDVETVEDAKRGEES
jgi:hypothetical protein